MASETNVLQVGSFTGTGNSEILNIRQDVDKLVIFNETEAGATSSGHGFRYVWTRSMGTAGKMAVEYHPAADHTCAIDMLTSAISFINTTNEAIGTRDATVSAVSNAAIPVATLTSTASLSAGDIVRFQSVTGALQLQGYDFTIGKNTFSGTTFSLDYMAQIVAGTAGAFRKINYDYLMYPRRRYISKITKASSAVVTMTVTHGYTVGQSVRINVPTVFGMSEIDKLIGNVTAIDTTNNTITLDIDSSGFSAFAFPLTADVPFSPAEVIPIGESGASHSGMVYDDAKYNTGYLGVKLAAGVKAPAGSSSDVIHYEAYKAFNY
jgi:hypothetical protein